MTDTRTDYIILSRTCNKLLRGLRGRIYQHFNHLYSSYHSVHSNNHGPLYPVASIIYRALEKQVSQEHLLQQRDREQLQLHQHPHLEFNGKAMQSFTDKHG